VSLFMQIKVTASPDSRVCARVRVRVCGGGGGSFIPKIKKARLWEPEE
jgi:hypothetical protein